jgi:hypothetical protein
MSRKPIHNLRVQPEILEARDLPSCWVMGPCCDPPPNHGGCGADVVEQRAGFRPFGQQNCGEFIQPSFPYKAGGPVKAWENPGFPNKAGELVCGNGAGKIIQPGVVHDQVMVACGHCDHPGPYVAGSCW